MLPILFFLSIVNPKIFDEKSFHMLTKESIQKYLNRNIGSLDLTSIPVNPLVLDIFEQKKWKKILKNNKIEKSDVNVLFFQGKHELPKRGNLDVMLMFGLYNDHFEALIGYNYKVNYPLSRIIID